MHAKRRIRRNFFLSNGCVSLVSTEFHEFDWLKSILLTVVKIFQSRLKSDQLSVFCSEEVANYNTKTLPTFFQNY